MHALYHDTRSWIVRLLLASGFLVVGAAARAETPGEAARKVFQAHCIECHGDRGFSGGLKIMDRESLSRRKRIIPGQPGTSLVMQRILSTEADMMPPEEKPRLKPAEVEAVKAWIATGGAPDFAAAAAVPQLPPDPTDTPPPTVGIKRPVDTTPIDTTPIETKPIETKPIGPGTSVERRTMDTDYVLAAILKDIRRLPAADRASVRYLSLAHLMAAGATPEELTAHRQALAKAINSLSWRRKLVRPVPLDETETVFRIDLRELGWDRRVAKSATGTAACNVFDLALLEYPYGVMNTPSESYASLAREYLQPAGLVRPIAFVRGDWFASTATQPPLYNEMLFLPRTLKEFEEGIGVKSQDNIDNFRVVRAGTTKSDVSQHNRVIEHHVSRTYGSYWRSYDFASSTGREDITRDPIHLQPSGGEMIFQLPNGLQGYLIVDGKGHRLDAAPTGIVTDKFAADKAVHNGLSCMRCHENGTIPIKDVIRPAVAGRAVAPGVDRQQVLALYPGQERIDEILKEDENRFTAAMKQLLGEAPTGEPLTAVSKRFLDKRLTVETVSAELGRAEVRGLKDTFALPAFAQSGLSPLSTGDVIAREVLETQHGEIVRRMGMGEPIAPIDAISRPNYQPATEPFTMVLKTNKAGNTFAKGDEGVLFLKASKDVFVEVIRTTPDGRKSILVSPTKVTARDTFRFPATGKSFTLSASGQEQITVLACENEFARGEVLTGSGVTDRVVHRMAVDVLGQPLSRGAGPSPFKTVKRTITLDVK